MDIATLSVEALKALAYDQVKLLQQTQNNVAQIEQELAKRTEKTEPTEGE
jgi:hypothetical protein